MEYKTLDDLVIVTCPHCAKDLKLRKTYLLFDSDGKAVARSRLDCPYCGNPVLEANMSLDYNPAPVESSSKSPSIAASTPSAWIIILKTVTIIWLVIGVLASLIAGITLIVNGVIVGGLGLLFGGCIATLILTAAVMVLLDLAADVRRIRISVENKK